MQDSVWIAVESGTVFARGYRHKVGIDDSG